MSVWKVTLSTVPPPVDEEVKRHSSQDVKETQP